MVILNAEKLWLTVEIAHITAAPSWRKYRNCKENKEIVFYVPSLINDK